MQPPPGYPGVQPHPPGYPGGPVPSGYGVAPQKSSSGKVLLGVLGGVVVLLLLIGGIVGMAVALSDDETPKSSAGSGASAAPQGNGEPDDAGAEQADVTLKEGDCLAEMPAMLRAGESDPSTKVVACDSSSAKIRVHARVDDVTTSNLPAMAKRHCPSEPENIRIPLASILPGEPGYLLCLEKIG